MSVSDAVRSYILENYLFTDDASALDNSESFMEKGIVDSTGMMEVISFLEEEFSIAVEDDEMVPENLDSVNAITGYIERKRADPRSEKTTTAG